MKSFLIIFNKKFSSSEYSNVVAYIKTASSWARLLENVWIVKASKSAPEIRDSIKSKLKNGDHMLVIEVNKHWATLNVSEKITDWMKTKM